MIHVIKSNLAFKVNPYSLDSKLIKLSKIYYK